MKAKLALVMGASSGLGQLTAERLAQAGYRVFGTSRTELASGSPGIEMLALDVWSESSVAACIEIALGRSGRIDLLVNNAGVAHASLVEETSLADAQAVLDTSFWGTVRLTNAALPAMRRRHAGRIISVGSLAGATWRGGASVLLGQQVRVRRLHRSAEPGSGAVRHPRLSGRTRLFPLVPA